MEALVNEMLDLPVWAVVGATQTEINLVIEFGKG